MHKALKILYFWYIMFAIKIQEKRERKLWRIILKKLKENGKKNGIEKVHSMRNKILVIRRNGMD